MGRTSYQKFEDWRLCVPCLMSELFCYHGSLCTWFCMLFIFLVALLFLSLLHSFFFPVACSVNQSRRSFSFCFVKSKVFPPIVKFFNNLLFFFLFYVTLIFEYIYIYIYIYICMYIILFNFIILYIFYYYYCYFIFFYF